MRFISQLHSNNKTYDTERRVYLPKPLRYLPFGIGYEVEGQPFVLKCTREEAERIAAVHKGEKNEAGWNIETVVIRHKERR